MTGGCRRQRQAAVSLFCAVGRLGLSIPGGIALGYLGPVLTTFITVRCIERCSLDWALRMVAAFQWGCWLRLEADRTQRRAKEGGGHWQPTFLFLEREGFHALIDGSERSRIWADKKPGFGLTTDRRC